AQGTAQPTAFVHTLLRAVETGEVSPLGTSDVLRSDARVICATAVDLRQAVAAGRFRPDLYHRLNGVTIFVPPLRNRRGDVPLLVRHLLGRYGAAELRVPHLIMEALCLSSWPGNVRELAQNLHAATVAASARGGTELTWLDFIPDLRLRETPPSEDEQQPPVKDIGERPSQDDVGEHQIVTALKHTGGNMNQAAAALGVSRSHLYELLRRFGLSAADFRGR
ncbi:MAG: sigma 54-interacting transcriptional regulator, partial [Pseudomonadota bacterium]